MSIRSFRAALAALCAVVGTGAPLSVMAEDIGRFLLGERLARMESLVCSQQVSQYGVRLANYEESATDGDAGHYPSPALVPSQGLPAAADELPLDMQGLPADTLPPPAGAASYDYGHGNAAHPYVSNAGCSSCPPCCDVSECCCYPVQQPLLTCYGECQLVFARPHIVEGGLGAGPNPMKLSEQYDLAPRTIVGIERFDGNGVRARYWHYDEQLADIANPGATVGFEFEVFDLEGYHRFCTSWADLTLSGGCRVAHIGTSFDGDWHDNTAIGLTFAADGESLICRYHNHYWSGVYGARLSVLGGDWASSGPGIPALRDDNFTVTELHAGLEHGCQIRAVDLYWRLGFEMQNWHSDALSGNTNTDSIGFVGPSFQFGASY